MKHDPANLELVLNEGGFNLLTQLLQHLALTYAQPAAVDLDENAESADASMEAAATLAARRLSGSQASTSTAAAAAVSLV